MFRDIFRHFLDSYQLEKKKKILSSLLLLTFEWILCCTFLISLSKYLLSKTFCNAIVPPKITALFSFQLSERTMDRSTKSPDLVEEEEILKQKGVAFFLQRDFVPSLQLIKKKEMFFCSLAALKPDNCFYHKTKLYPHEFIVSQSKQFFSKRKGLGLTKVSIKFLFKAYSKPSVVLHIERVSCKQQNISCLYLLATMRISW